MKKEFLLAGILVAVDQILKILAILYADQEGFIYLIYNTGITFGFFQGANTLMIALSIIVIGILVYVVHKGKQEWAYAIILAGVTGNFIDRIVHQAVVDYISIGTFPIFNLADVMITGTIAFVVLQEFIQNSSKSSRSSR